MIKQGWECHPDPESRLGQQKKAVRFTKRQVDYQRLRDTFKDGWSRVVERLSEAGRFQTDFLAAVAALPS
jgi:hypothetical protein